MSVSDIERGLVARYIHRILKREEITLRATRHILGWLKERSSSLNLPLPKPLVKVIGNMYSPQFKAHELQKVYNIHREEVLNMLDKAAKETALPEPMLTNVKMLASELGLPETAWKIAGLIACYNRYEYIEYLCDAVIEVTGPVSRATALLTDENTRTVEKMMSPLGEIITSGLIQINEDGEQLAGTTGRYSIPWRVDLCLDQHYTNFEELRQAFLGKPFQSDLFLEDYEHVAQDRDLIVNLLKGVIAKKARGINILLYGPPGSGKTELTKVVSSAAKISLYGAGEESAAIDGESDRSSRLSDLVFALRLLAGAHKTALLFDEMEDVAWKLIRRGGSKLYLNRILESNPVPVLWTSNNIDEIDPAVLRRMTLVVDLKKPPAKQRERIIASLDKKIGVGLSKDQIRELSNVLDATPAVLENALKAAKFSGGDHTTVRRAALGVVRAISGVQARSSASHGVFDEHLANTNVDLMELTEKLSSSGKHAFSLLMSGPPGTGKSAYARYLAGKLGLEVYHKRASDLLGAFVGESEKLIADAFETARENKAMLIFDEADSFLFDRRDALRSWEITQVNEMLTWMEDHPYPTCFTTNLVDRFDKASLRRFTFHVRFDYLGRKALKRAYRLFFHLPDVPESGLRFTNLTPGDFAQCARQADVLGVMADGEKIVELMEDISRHKPGTSSGKIGFLN